MAIVVNTNIASLNAQRNLTGSGRLLNQSLQRLSSGLRINSAKDDTAGLAISTRMNAQVRGLNQAARNANDGISLAQTAEGAMSEITNNLQRIRELAIQSANSTNTATDRASLDAESTQLIAEITRVATQTQFNGLSLLDGTFTSKAFQVGANANQTISIDSIANAQSTALGSNTLAVAGSAMNAVTVGTDVTTALEAVSGVLAQPSMTVTTANGGTTAAFSTIVDGSSAKAIATAIENAASGVGVTATASNSAELSALSVAGTVSFTLGGTASAAISAVVADPTDLTDLVASINGSAGTTGITATFTSTSAKDSITLTSNDGSDISILDYANTGAVGATVDFSSTTLTEGADDSGRKTGTVSLSSSKGAISLGATTGGTVFNSLTSSFSSVAGLSLTSDTNAQAAIAVVDAALGQISSSRGDLGAIQNRFESTISNLMNVSENISAAQSRIVDADFAAETASLTKSQILQQAGLAMLSQANQVPQAALTLLQG
jgi:flagellin